jgi:hypothetical protein
VIVGHVDDYLESEMYKRTAPTDNILMGVIKNGDRYDLQYENDKGMFTVSLYENYAKEIREPFALNDVYWREIINANKERSYAVLYHNPNRTRVEQLAFLQKNDKYIAHRGLFMPDSSYFKKSAKNDWDIALSTLVEAQIRKVLSSSKATRLSYLLSETTFHH